MNNTRAFRLSNSPLLHSFQTFYYEIIRLKEKALRYTEGSVSVEQNDLPYQQTVQLVDDIQTRLKMVLEEQQSVYTRATGGISAPLFNDAQYIMTVLADEIFLNLSWSGSKEWRFLLLEGQLFQTQVAGELFFKKIDALCEGHDLARYELAQLYLMALSLGFRGQYRDHDSTGRVNWYQNKLYQLCCHESSRLFSSHSTKALFDECYAHTLNESPGKGLPDLRTWGIYSLCVFLIYIFVSYIVWYRIAFEMHRDLNVIFSQTLKQPKSHESNHGR